MDETASTKIKKKKSIKRRIAVYAFIVVVSFFLLVLSSIPVSIYEKPGDLLAVENSQSLVIENNNLVDVRTGGIFEDRQL